VSPLFLKKKILLFKNSTLVDLSPIFLKLWGFLSRSTSLAPPFPKTKAQRYPFASLPPSLPHLYKLYTHVEVCPNIMGYIEMLGEDKDSKKRSVKKVYIQLNQLIM
jgi:hypothetical protein